MKRAVILALAALTLGAQQPRVRRASLHEVEKNCDARIVRLVESQFALLGPTRAHYLEGYGAVLSAEVDLSPGPAANPFRSAISKEDKELVRARKLQRLPLLRTTMREMLMAAAASLDEVPAQERVAFGITLLGKHYEDLTGMPSQIVMRGERGKLIDAKLGRVAVDSVVQAQEF